ncbi:hypothetical protein EYB25_008494 [Talaromyces marneffei]|nr:hypothetical protein EYB25_008494 [Talaromyces marneffei]
MALLKLFKRKKSKSQTISADQNVNPTEQPSPEQMGFVIANSTNPAFQEAWKQHWMGLDDSERAAWSFQGHNSPLKMQRTIEDMDKLHLQETASRRIAGPTLRFLRAIETVMAGATIGIQAYPDVSSIIVGIIRVVINVAVKYFEYYEKLSKMLEELVDDIQVLDLFTQNNANSPELHDTLVALYTNILAFCRHARRVFHIQGASSLAVLVKVQWAPFEEEFGEIRANLNRYTAKLDRVTAAITMNTALAIREESKKTSSSYAQNERKEFLDGICGDRIEEIHNMICEQRLADTGSSIFRHSVYEKWVSEQCTGPLWIYGAAGTGKSVLASMVIDHFSQDSNQKDHAVAYVYIKGEDTTLRGSPSRIVSMLIKQLCWKLETLPSQTLDYYRQCKKDARLPVLNKLETMFIECAGSLSRVVAIIDGLDECEEKSRKPILDFIIAASQQTDCKFLVTSQWEWDIERAFRRTKSLIIPDMTSDLKDIARVVKYRVEKELGHLSLDTQEYLTQQLVEKSGGIFLWIDFQLNDLAQVIEHDVKAQLSVLPSDLQATYIQYLRKINAQPITNKKLAQRCFLWAFYTDRLLSSGEFLDAIALVNDHEKVKYNAFDLMAITKKLIRVTNIIFPRVRPVHFSLREFAVNLQSELPLELQSMIPDNETANARLAIECLQHLLADIPPEEFMRNILPYCGSHFDTHIRRLTTIPEEILQILDRILFTEEHKLLKILIWRWPVPIGEELEPEFGCIGNPQSIDPMFFLRCTKLYQIPAIRSRYATIERIEAYPDGYLHIAAMTGLDDVVGELIERGVDPNREDTGSFTALQALSDAEECSETIVIMLLKAGGDPYKATKSGRSPYEHAQNRKREKFVQILSEFKGLKAIETSENGVVDETHAEHCPPILALTLAVSLHLLAVPPTLASINQSNLPFMQNVIETSTSPAFQEAWRKHWDDLSDSEKGLWSHQHTQTPLQIEETMKKLDKDHLDESLLRKISDRTLGFLQVIDLLMRGATVAVQGAPSVGSVVLGVFRVVIDAAVRYLEYYEKLTEMMEYLIGLLHTVGVYDGIKFNEPRLHETLVSIYASILAFCSDALEVFAKVQWAPFEKKFGQIRDDLQHQIENLNIVSNAVTMKSVMAIEANMNKKQSLKAQKERRDFLDWICKHDVETLHDEIDNKRHKDTGSWLLETDSFKSWVNQNKENILWLNGPPGTGKSVLASVAINHLIKRSKHTQDTVIYAYFKGEETNSQYLPTQMISSLVKQLCWALPALPEPAIEFYSNFLMNGRRPSFNDLESLFLKCLKLFERVFVVLDGLDECEQKHRKMILNFVFGIGAQSEDAKIFVASRKQIDILHAFRRHKFLHVSSRDPLAQEDIAKLIKHRVATELSHIDPEVRETVVQTVTEKSNGMYLWVDLQLTDIAQVPEADIERQLELLPSGLEDTYAPSLMLSLSHKTTAQQKKPYDAHTLNEVTFGLLTIGIIPYFRVRTIHFSLKEFVTDPNANHPDDLRGFLPDTGTANAKMAIMCLQHLMSDTEPQDFFETCLSYCAEHFDGHIQSLTIIPEELWKVLDCIFLERPEMLKRILAWKWPSQAYDYPSIVCMGNPKSVDRDVFMRCTKLHEIPAVWSRYRVADRSTQDYPLDNVFLAALFGLDDILEKIIFQGVNINGATADRFTALHLAIGVFSEDSE